MSFFARKNLEKEGSRVAALGEAVVLGQLLPLEGVHGNADQELTIGPFYQLEHTSRVFLQGHFVHNID